MSPASSQIASILVGAHCCSIPAILPTGRIVNLLWIGFSQNGEYFGAKLGKIAQRFIFCIFFALFVHDSEVEQLFRNITNYLMHQTQQVLRKKLKYAT